MATKILAAIGAFLIVALVLNYGIREVAKKAIENSGKATFPTTRITFQTWDANKPLNVTYQPKPAIKSVGAAK